ncbi:hypothetical protein [Streptomyces roseoverticillatus]|uniref:hypothetical protein n=1 Tax=Streptomyces roseoverticillatus TaxID=66429 RepID=UPI000B257B1A|nr:hypothetical protein [Streptomyces roseoverticillatus]
MPPRVLQPEAASTRLRALVPQLAGYDDGQEPIAGLDGFLSRMPEAVPLDSLYGGSAR